MNKEEPAPDTAAERSKLFDLAIAQQERFDAIAAEQDRSSDKQIALRAEMLALLSGNEVRNSEITALRETEEPSDAERIRELIEVSCEASLRFDRAAAAYMHERHMDATRIHQLRDTLAALLATRDRLRELGADAPDLIEHESLARDFEPIARKAMPRLHEISGE